MVNYSGQTSMDLLILLKTEEETSWTVEVVPAVRQTEVLYGNRTGYVSCNNQITRFGLSVGLPCLDEIQRGGCHDGST